MKIRSYLAAIHVDVNRFRIQKVALFQHCWYKASGTSVVVAYSSQIVATFKYTQVLITKHIYLTNCSRDVFVWNVTLITKWMISEGDRCFSNNYAVLPESIIQAQYKQVIYMPNSTWYANEIISIKILCP